MIKFLSSQEIEDAADSFLKRYHPERSLPVPIEEILDLKLGINIIPIPGLFNLYNIDAILSSDLTELYIDHDHLEYRYNRGRYSLAHEAGHLILHGDYLAGLKRNSLETWKGIILRKGAWHAAMETQANIFASFLLMPGDHLEREFERAKAEFKAHPFFSQAKFLADNRMLIPFVAGKIGCTFDVSEEAVEYRLMNWINSGRYEKEKP
jgi:Zn-dependent peptidase ImmA (M78 family)